MHPATLFVFIAIANQITACSVADAISGADLRSWISQSGWSCETYLKTGKMMPADGIQQLRPFDAIFLGAVGHPTVADHVSLWGLLIPIRRHFRQYVNLRPVRLFEGIETPLKNWKAGDIDFCIVRENNEGEYSNIGGRDRKSVV